MPEPSNHFLANREQLPQRRACETFELRHGGKQSVFRVTLGYYDRDMRKLGEVFITGAKSGTEVEANVRDTAILVSLALQHGVPIATMAAAITREGNGTASTIIGCVLDKLTEQAAEIKPHAYVPSAAHMGDCAVCGHLQETAVHK